MYNKIRNILFTNFKSIRTKGSFAQNFALTFSGNAVGITSQVLFAPLIARIYGPEAYGSYSIFSALVLNLAMIGNLYFINAFVLPKDEEEFISLVRITYISSTTFSVLVFLATLFFGNQILSLFNSEKLGNWVYLIGPSVLLTCINDISTNIVTRKKAFKENVSISVPISIGTKLFNIGFGVITSGISSGLIIGDLLAKIFAVYFRVKVILKQTIIRTLQKFTLQSLKKTYLKYKSFPLYILPGNWINLLSGQMPIYFLTIYFDHDSVGQYAFATNLLEIPMVMLGTAITPVFLQKAAEVQNNAPERLPSIVKEVYFKLLFIGIVPFSFLTVFGDIIFSFVFGEKWLVAGVFAGFLGYFYILRLISSPLSSVFTIINKEKELFHFQLLIFVIRMLGLGVGIFIFNSAKHAILFFSVGNALAYFYLSILIFKLLKIKYLKILLKGMFIITGTLLIFYFLKYMIIP